MYLNRDNFEIGNNVLSYVHPDRIISNAIFGNNVLSYVHPDRIISNAIKVGDKSLINS